VGLLARKSSHSTQTIQELINHSLQGIEDGSKAVTRLEDNLQQVTGLVGNLSSLLNDISVATLSQGEYSSDDTSASGAEPGVTSDGCAGVWRVTGFRTFASGVRHFTPGGIAFSSSRLTQSISLCYTRSPF
jgi:hypothetical protein